MKYLRKQPLSVILIILIWIVCMIPIPETPLSHLSLIDKWTHFIMYGTLTFVICYEYGKHHTSMQWQRFTIGAILLPVVMGGLVELAQAYLTNGVRSGDWLDFAANSIGVAIGSSVGVPLARHLVKS